MNIIETKLKMYQFFTEREQMYKYTHPHILKVCACICEHTRIIKVKRNIIRNHAS